MDARPSLPAVINQIKSALRSAFALKYRNSDGNAIATAFGGAAYSLHLRADQIQRQQFPQLADEDALIDHGLIRNIVRKLPVGSTGAVSFIGPDLIPESTRLVDNNGNEYITLQAGSIDIQAQSLGTGSDKNKITGEILSLVEPVGVTTQARVTSEFIGGNDLESVEELRNRIVFKWQNPDGGGNPTDYIGWLKTNQSVIKADVFPRYPVPGATSWAVAVSSVNGLALPDDAIIQQINDYLDRVAPIDAAVIYLNESRLINIDVVITGISDPGDQAAVRESLVLLFDSKFKFFGSWQIDQITGEITENEIRNAIAQRVGTQFSLIYSNQDKVGIGRLSLGEALVLGRVLF